MAAPHEKTALLGEKSTSIPKFASAKNQLPQCIAHRGYKVAWPENTMGAFKGAVNIGAHAIETDIHLSKDGVVVLSHDATLQRCFGVEDSIIDCDWEYLKTVQTIAEPHQLMPRLKDLLEYLATPGLEDIWILLDIKLDNDADDVIRLIGSTLEEVEPNRPWNERVVLGCWTAAFVPICQKYMPTYPITHIGWDIAYARQFLRVPGVSFNMFHQVIPGPIGKAFLRDIRIHQRTILLWVINDTKWMKWCISKKVDGVITDDPKKYLEVCKTYQGERVNLGVSTYLRVVLMTVLISIGGVIYRTRRGCRMAQRAASITKGAPVPKPNIPK